MSQAIYRRYRPMTFAEVTDQQHVKLTLQNQITGGSVAHAYLFSGPRGVGKTTIARLLAKSVNCQQRKESESEPCNECSSCTEMNAGSTLDVVEIDAASHTGVDNVRENIIENVRFAPSKGKMKVFIIDEVHMLSTSAFNALLKTLEEPPAHALFVLATTEIHKIPQTILSRCQRFDFKRIATPDLVARLKKIAGKEGVTIEDAVLGSIARLSEGCLRDAESLLGQILALGDKKIGVDQASIILPVTNTESVVTLIDAVTRRDLPTVIEQLNVFVDQGGSVKNYTDELIDFTRNLLLSRIGGKTHDHYDAATVDRMEQMKMRLNDHEFAVLLDALLRAKVMPAPDALAQLPLEIVLTEFCSLAGAEASSTAHSDPPPDTGVSKGSPPASGSDGSKHSSLPVGLGSKPLTAPSNSQSTAGSAPEGTRAPGTLAKASFTVKELKDKWKRCCEAVAKRNIALPLVLQMAKPSAIHNEFVEIGFEHRFHFETMLADKNIELLSAAINEVMQSAIRVRPVFLTKEEDQALGQLAEAFGGEVVS